MMWAPQFSFFFPQRTVVIHDPEFNNPTEFRKHSPKFRAAQVTQIYRAGNSTRGEVTEGTPASMLETLASLRLGLCYALEGQDYLSPPNSKWNRAEHRTEIREVKHRGEDSSTEDTRVGPCLSGQAPWIPLECHRHATKCSLRPHPRSKDCILE